jgi:hypothetical protein
MISIKDRIGNVITVSTPENLALGCRVKLEALDELKSLRVFHGYIVPLAIEGNYEVRFNDLPQTLDIQTISSVIWWRTSYKPNSIVDPSIFIPSESTCRLEVQCARASEGYLSWELYHNNNLIVRGNDMNTPGWCMFTAQGLLPAGSYYLEIRHCYLGVTIGRGSTNWTVLQPTTSLESSIAKTVGTVDVR